MKKLLSLVLSVCLLTGSFTPALAGAAQSASAQQARIQTALERADMKAKQKAVSAGEILRTAAALSQPYDAYQAYKTTFLEELSAVEKEALASHPQNAAYIKKAVKELRAEKNIRHSWKVLSASPAYKTWAQENERRARAYLKTLSRAAVKLAQKYPAKHQNLLTQALPAFAAAGAVEPAQKQAAGALLRQILKTQAGQCRGGGNLQAIKIQLGNKTAAAAQAKKCQQVLSAVYALGVLGADDSKFQSADAAAIAAFLQQTHDGMMGPSVITVSAQSLLAMNAHRRLAAELVEISRKLPDIGLFGKDFSFISVGDWVKFATQLNGDFATGLEYSFYKKGKYANQYNAWTDLGQYLAQTARVGNGAHAQSARYVLDSVMDDCVWYDRFGNPAVKFKPFVTGALAGGYKINKRGQVYTQLNKGGKVSRVDTRQNRARAQAKMKKLGVNQSGYFAAALFYGAKDDLDPYTQLYINNKLVDAYRQSGSKASFKGLAKHARPAAQALKSYRHKSAAITVGQVADVVLAVAAIGKLAVSAVKMGTQGLKTGVRVLRLARAQAAANGLTVSANAGRILRLGRVQAYGVRSAKEVMLGSVRNTLNIKSVLPPPAVKIVKNPQTAAALKSGKTYTQPADFKAPAQSVSAPATSARATALTPKQIKARARKAAAKAKAQKEAAISRQMDKELIQKVAEKAQLDAAWKQTRAYQLEQQAAQAARVRQLAWDAKIDKWTFGKGSTFLKLARDKAFALNLSLLLQFSTPQAAMSVRGVTPLTALAKTETVYTAARSTAQTAHTFKWAPTKAAAPVYRLPINAPEPRKMAPLMLGKWGQSAFGVRPSWFKLPAFSTLAPSLVPAKAAPALAYPAARFSFFGRTGASNNGYIYSGLPLFSLGNAAKKMGKGLKNLFPQNTVASRYVLYATSFIMGLEVASPILTDLGMSLGLNMDDNSLVTVATYLPYFLGAMLSDVLQTKLGAKKTLGLGLGLNIAGLASGVLLSGLNGHFLPEVDTQAHFARILASIALASSGMILIQNSVGTVLEHLSRVAPDLSKLPENERLGKLEKYNIKTQIFRSVGIIMTYLFPWASKELLGLDWSFAFVLPLPILTLGLGLFCWANLPNIKNEAAPKPKAGKSVSARLKTALKNPARTAAGAWKGIKNSGYVSLFKEDSTAKYLIPAAFFLNVIEVSIHNGLMFLLPTMDISDSTRYLLSMLQFAGAFLIGRMIAPWVLQKFPRYKMTLGGGVALAGIAAALPFAQSNAYLFTGGLFAAEIAISTLFTLLFGAAAKNPKTQGRTVSLIIASAISCAFGPLWLANAGQWALTHGILGERAAMAAALIAAPLIMTVLSFLMLYKLESSAVKKAKQAAPKK